MRTPTTLPEAAHPAPAEEAEHSGLQPWGQYIPKPQTSGCQSHPSNRGQVLKPQLPGQRASDPVPLRHLPQKPTTSPSASCSQEDQENWFGLFEANRKLPFVFFSFLIPSSFLSFFPFLFLLPSLLSLIPSSCLLYTSDAADDYLTV